MKYEVCSGEVMKWESIHATTSTRYKLLSTQVEVGRAVPGKLEFRALCVPSYCKHLGTLPLLLLCTVPTIWGLAEKQVVGEALEWSMQVLPVPGVH